MDSHHLPPNLALHLDHYLHFRQPHQPPTIFVIESRVRRPNLDLLALLQPQRIVLINSCLLLSKFRRSDMFDQFLALECGWFGRRVFRSRDRRVEARDPSVDFGVDLRGEEVRRERTRDALEPVKGPDRCWVRPQCQQAREYRYKMPYS